MAQPNPALTTPHATESDALNDAAAIEPIGREVVQLLRRAARLAAEHGTDSDLFMQAAWAACLDARPGLREQLADKQLRSELKKLRKRGLVGSA